MATGASYHSRQGPIPSPDLATQRPFQTANEQGLCVGVVSTVSDRLPVDLDHVAGRGRLDPQDGDVGQGQIEARVVTGDGDVEAPHPRGQVDRLGGVGVLALPVVQVQLARGGAVDPGGHDDGPGRVAGVPGGHGHLLGGQDGPAPDVHRDVAQGGVDRRVLARGRLRHRGLVVPVVVHVGALDEPGEDPVDGRGALGEDRGDEDRGAQEELSVGVGQRRVVGELPGHGPHDRVAPGVGVVEQGVQVRQQLEPHGHGRPGGVGDAGPDVGLLRVGRQGVVVAVKGEEGAELHPPVAQLLVAVAVEAARVDAEHGDAEQAETQGLRDGKVHVVELGHVVAAPVPRHRAGPGERRPADDERALARPGGQETGVRGPEDLVAEQVVDVVLLDAVVVGGVGGDRVDGEVPLDVVDHVRGVVDVARSRRGRRAEVTRRGGGTTDRGAGRGHGGVGL